MAAALLAAAAIHGPAVAQEVTYNGAFLFATGEYIFTERTSSAYLFNGFSVSEGRVRATLSFPLIWQDTPYISYTSGGVIPSGGPQHSTVGTELGTPMGMGPGSGGTGQMGGRRVIVLPPSDAVVFDAYGISDPLVRADVELLDERSGFATIGVNGAVKFPLSDVDSGFGTGEWDYSGGISLAKTAGRGFFLVDASYWVLGDMPDLEIKDPVALSVAYGRSVGSSGRYSIMGSVYASTPTLEGVDPPLTVAVTIMRLFDGGRSVSLTAYTGLTESVSDFSFAVGWRLPLRR
jgi:hypothetical protein